MRKERKQIQLAVHLLGLILLIQLILNQNVKAQYIVDWSNAHTDTRIDFMGWGYVNVTATLTSNNEFSVRWIPDHGDVIINYLNYDGSKWTAKLNGDKFIHAREGNFDVSHEDTRIDYIANDGSNCSATINGNVFNVTNRTTNQTYLSDNIYFLTWNHSRWTAGLSKPNFIYWRGTVEKSSEVTPSLKYLAPGGGLWTATILSDGTFNHTDANGKSHTDRIIIYLNYDRSIWGATLDLKNKIFNHAPARLAPPPPSTPPPPPKIPPLPAGASQFRGIPIQETNGLVYFRFVTEQGVCTNDISTIDARRVIGKYKSGSCYNLGQVRDIYLYYYK